MTRAQEMRTPLHNLKLHIRRVHKQLDLLPRIRNGVHDIGTAMQPQHGTHNITQASMESIPIPQIHSRHAGPLPAIVTAVVALDGLPPEVAHVRGTVLPEANVDQEIAVVEVRRPVVADGLGRRPRGDGESHVVHAVPAAELARPLGLVVHACAEGDDTRDDIGREKRHSHGDPAALGGAEDEDLALDAEGGDDLQVHDRRVPVGEVGCEVGDVRGRFGGGETRLAVPEQLDGEQVHVFVELGVGVLLAVELGGGGEAVDEDEGGLGGVVGVGHLVAVSGG